jgi:hypothetical protein
LTQLDERANYVDAHLYGSRAVENRGRHDRAVLGEDAWAISPTTPLIMTLT